MLMHNPNTGELLEVVSAVDEVILIWAADIAQLHGEPDLSDNLRDFVNRVLDTRASLTPEWYPLRADPA